MEATTGTSTTRPTRNRTRKPSNIGSSAYSSASKAPNPPLFMRVWQHSSHGRARRAVLTWAVMKVVTFAWGLFVLALVFSCGGKVSEVDSGTAGKGGGGS